MTKKPGTMVLFTFAALVFSTFGCGSGGGNKGGGLFGGGGSGGSGGGDPILTPEQETGATAICEKAGSCGLVSSSEMSECKDQFAGALQIFPDPDKFSDCINTMECSAIEDMDTQTLMACLDLNRDSYVCTDSSTLRGCDTSGKCASVACTDVCELMGGYTFDHCGASNNSQKAKNICWCRQ